jgi:hypothetical protein
MLGFSSLIATGLTAAAISTGFLCFAALQYSGSANLKPYVALELHPGILHTSIL